MAFRDTCPQIKTIGGYRQDALKWHPNGLAIDVMIPNHDSPDGIELGNQIAGFALANAKRWGINHVIWRQKIYPGVGKGSWRRTVIAAQTDADVFTTVNFNRDLTVERSGDWMFLYQPKAVSLIPPGLMSVDELEAHLSAVASETSRFPL